MSDDKTPSDKKTGDVARRIWLAGIGAYGKAFEEGKDTLKGLTGGTSGVFDDLAAKGEKIQQAAMVKGAQLAGKASDLKDDINAEERISAMRARLLGGGSGDRIDAVEARLASIEDKLDALLKMQTKPTPKRAATRRTTTTKKTAAKKKPAAKK